jgi:hypothetical protein
MPGASAIGKLVRRPIKMQQTAATAAAAAVAGPNGTPAAERMAGFATMMYDIVRRRVPVPRAGADKHVSARASYPRTRNSSGVAD